MKRVVYCFTFSILLLSLFPACKNNNKATKNPIATQYEAVSKGHKTFSFQSGDIRFEVEVKGEGSLNQVYVQSIGAGISSQKVEFETDPVRQVYFGDFNNNNKPNLLFVCRSAGSGSYESIEGYEFDGNNFHPIENLPLPTPDDGDFMGHDSLWMLGKFLHREYPVYKANDPNAAPSGGMNMVKYQLNNQLKWDIVQR